MAVLSASGLGSGLDVNSLVSQLVAAERAPNDQRIARREVKVTTQVSALATLKSALSSFKTALETVRTAAGFAPRKVTVSDTDIFTATATESAAAGRYNVEVVRLATAHQLASGPLASSSTVVGTGTLTISSGTNSFDVVIDDTNQTLAGIRDAINAQAENTSVQATLVHEQGGSHLVLSARKTGAAYAVEVAASGGNGGLNQLVYDADGTQNLTPKQLALDAHVRIAGFDHYSASNSVSGAIDGVTLSLEAAEEGKTLTLDIANDDVEVLDRLKKFVAAFNTLQTALGRLRSFSADTQAAGPLLGDSMLNSVEEQIRRGLTDNVSGLNGTYRSLASLGITRQVDGSLKLDETKVRAAIEADRGAVTAVFSSTDGVAARLYSRIEAHLASDGAISARDNSLKKSLALITKDKEQLELRMASVEARYRRQFTALDALLSRMTSTSSFLASQLANVPSSGS